SSRRGSGAGVRKAIIGGVVLCVLLAIGAGALLWATMAPLPQGSRTERGLSDRPTIAVLPFITLESDAQSGYFGDGLTEDLISALGRFSEFAVLSRNSLLP